MFGCRLVSVEEAPHRVPCEVGSRLCWAFEPDLHLTLMLGDEERFHVVDSCGTICRFHGVLVPVGSDGSIGQEGDLKHPVLLPLGNAVAKLFHCLTW